MRLVFLALLALTACEGCTTVTVEPKVMSSAQCVKWQCVEGACTCAD